MDYNEIDRKWQKEWQDAGIFEGDVNNNEPYMVTVAFPYVNAPLHIGHIRTYGTADVLARYKRMNGYNVLFPMAFHATGTPILAFAKRIKNGDKDLVSELKLFGIPDSEIEKMSDPEYIASYFTREIEAGMRRTGLSIDWRRKFVSTEPMFSKFVEWQFGLLNSKGYIVKGRHPVGWCPNENQAVGMHDTKKDAEPEIEKELAIAFRIDGEDAYFLCATYRPETVSGATNIFVKASAVYSKCTLNGKGPFYISKVSSASLKYQFAVEQLSEISGSELLSKSCQNPVTGLKLPVLDGFFVDDSLGTGIVMSVPAHAPFDYAAIEKLKASGTHVEITPIRVMEIKGKEDGKEQAEPYVDVPSMKYMEMFKSKTDEYAMLEAATKQQYRDEFHYGHMIAEGYAGMGEAEAKERISHDLTSSGKAMDIYVIANHPVVCRCGHSVVVKVVEDQWFLNYGNKEWKALAKSALDGMSILPEKSRKAFESAIDWIDLRAVARAQGLGTRFPLDNSKIIESLSDSTMYMCFYTISNLLRGIDPQLLKPEVFDYILLGKGSLDAVSKSSGIDGQVLKRCRESFEYWYKVTSRHSATELIFNHLTMYIFNHSALLEKSYWPKQIVVNGTVLSDGEKMSKSLGNIVPLVAGAEKYGTDVVRALVIAGADLFSDSEFSEVAAKGIDERLSYLMDIAGRIDQMETGQLGHNDYWLYSRLNRKINTATSQIEKLELRGFGTSVLYDSVLELRRYISRGEPNAIVVKDFVAAVTLMLCPIAPHISEEIWHIMGNRDFASTEKWPSPDLSLISDKVEDEEKEIDEVISDAKRVMSLLDRAGKAPKSIRLVVAEDWKRSIYRMAHKSRNMKQVMDLIGTSEGQADLGIPGGKEGEAAAYASSIAKRINSIPDVQSSQEEEHTLLNDAASFISKSLGCKVTVELAQKSSSKRAGNAHPLKPSIDVET